MAFLLYTISVIFEFIKVEVFRFIIIYVISMLEPGQDAKLIPISNLGNTIW